MTETTATVTTTPYLDTLPRYVRWPLKAAAWLVGTTVGTSLVLAGWTLVAATLALLLRLSGITPDLAPTVVQVVAMGALYMVVWKLATVFARVVTDQNRKVTK